MKQLNVNTLKKLGTISTIAGICVNLFSGWVTTMQVDSVIEKKVAEAMSKCTNMGNGNTTDNVN